MRPELAATLLFTLPLAGAFLLPTAYRAAPTLARPIGPALLLAGLAVAAGLWGQVGASGPIGLAVGGFLPPAGIVLYLDRLAAGAAFATAATALLLWPRGAAGSVREQVLTLLVVASGTGVCLSGDLFNLYVFYEILAVASYGLAAGRGTGRAYAAAVRYLILGALGSALALLGIGLIYAATGTLNLAHLATLAAERLDGALGMAAFALIAIGLGVKAELFPVNAWVPEVYSAAEVRVSGLLAGLVSKLAVLILLKPLVTVYAGTDAPALLLVLGALGVASGELAALAAGDVRRMLAYSSIGQLGLVILALAVPGPAGLAAAMALGTHHLVVKPALFLLAERWGGPLGRLAGGARASPLATALLLLLVLSLVGVPPLPGFWAKLLLLQALLGADGTVYAAAAAVVLVATVVEAAYLFRLVRALFAPGRPVHGPEASELVPASLLAALVLAGTLAAGPIGDRLRGVAAEVSDRTAYLGTVLAPSHPGAGP